jgi:cell division protein ZipA
MEADILRLILFLIGAVLIFGIYAADLYKRKKQNQTTKQWMSSAQEQPVAKHTEPKWDSFYSSDDDQDRADRQEELQQDEEESPEVDTTAITAKKDERKDLEENLNSELEQLEELLHEEHSHSVAVERSAPRDQMSISFFTSDNKKQAQQEKTPSLPEKIIQLNIVPRDHAGLFYGDDILCVAQDVGMDLGEMDIFHHYGDDSERKQAVYSMASMVEPGVFPVDNMDSFSTPGLAIFTMLPGPKDGLSIFADMLYTAEQLANLLDGELRDETHSALSKQTISHIREEIQEHHRQLQLARSKQ